MARSVEELRRESELTRAQLAATLSQLKEQITDTAEDIRHKISPQHVKAEVSEFVIHKTQSWVGALKQKATENPMQVIAAGSAVAVPLLRLMRGFPLPMLMMGAGLALTSKSVRDRAAETADPGLEKAREIMGNAAERAQSLRSEAAEAVSSAGGHAAGMASDAQNTATDVGNDLRNRAADAADTVASKVRAGMDAASGYAKDAMERARAAARDTATAAPAAASRVIQENAVLIGGLGLAIGAIIAASLPATRREGDVMGEASDGVRRAADAAVQSGFQAAKDAARSAAEAAAESLAQADLGKHASRITEGLADRFKEAADDVVTTTFDPPQNSHA